MLAIIKNTFREALAKKIFIGYYLFYVIVILVTIFLVNVDTIEGVIDMVDKKTIIQQFETGFIAISWSLIIFFSIISTASFIPSMLEKGTIDLILSKPISRTKILISKFLGAVIFVFISIVFLLGSIWLIVSLKSGYWDVRFLAAVLTITLTYSVMYSIVILFGLITNSSIISILVNFFLIFVLCPILSVRELVIFPILSDSTVQFIINFFYYILPKPGEIKDITNAIITGDAINIWKTSLDTEAQSLAPSWMSMFSSVLFGAVMLAGSVYYFSKKDY